MTCTISSFRPLAKFSNLTLSTSVARNLNSYSILPIGAEEEMKVSFTCECNNKHTKPSIKSTQSSWRIFTSILHDEGARIRLTGEGDSKDRLGRSPETLVVFTGNSDTVQGGWRHIVSYCDGCCVCCQHVLCSNPYFSVVLSVLKQSGWSEDYWY